MHSDHHIFIEAIKHKKKVSIKVRGDKGSHITTKLYRPLFYISASGQDSSAHYYLWYGEKEEKGDILWLAPDQIISIEPTQELFDPASFTLVGSEHLSQEGPQSCD
jgi:hypothetical protein